MAYGTVNADVIQSSVSGVSLGAGNATNFKNRLINGSMTFDQRNAGANITPTNAQYTLDRWQAALTQNSKYTVGQNAGSVTPPAGFVNYLGVTSSSAYSVGASDTFSIRQYIEGYNFYDFGFGTANAKTVTLSFWVYSSLTGTFGGSMANYAGTRSYPFSYTVSSANTWTQVSITIPGDTGGTWVGATNGGAAIIHFGLGSGSTYSGTAGSWSSTYYIQSTGSQSIVGTNGATWYITGVQLEVGSLATGFEYRSYGAELVLCQRYFELTYSPGYAQGSATSSGQMVATLSSQAYPRWAMFFKVTKRTAPSTRYWDTNGVENQWQYWNNGSTGTSGWSNQTVNEHGIYTELNNSTTFTVRANGYGHWASSAEL